VFWVSGALWGFLLSVLMVGLDSLQTRLRERGDNSSEASSPI
jgi:hypothetical protein